MSLQLSYGYWGPNSFPDRAQACATTIDGMSAFYVEKVSKSGIDILAWYHARQAQQRTGTEPVLEAWSSRREDRDLLRSILWSVARVPDQ
jgi:hypothetical protein